MNQEEHMESEYFDRLARAVSTRLPRRSLSGLLCVSSAGLSSVSLPQLAEARKNKKKKKKVKKNDFGCVNVGKYCKNDGQCCSGICEGKKNKKKCQAHDESTCQAGQDLCLGVDVPCTTTKGDTGQCVTTTGNAPYCFSGGDCFPCSKDSDCVAFTGVGSACIVCVSECFGENPQATACVGLEAII